MACAQLEVRWITWWETCWKWIIPYPCKKGELQERYRYDFSPLNSEFRFFRTHYIGCCDGQQYEWDSGFCLFCRGNGSLGLGTFYFKRPLTPVGECRIDNIPDWDGPVVIRKGLNGPDSFDAGPIAGEKGKID